MLANLVIWGIFGIIGGKLYDILFEALHAKDKKNKVVIIYVIIGFFGTILSLFAPMDIYSILAFIVGFYLHVSVLSKVIK